MRNAFNHRSTTVTAVPFSAIYAALFSLLQFTLLLQHLDGVSALVCMTCTSNRQESTELNNFRISARNPQPSCTMEPVKCNRDQDACVTIVMRSGAGFFWIGSGCEYRRNFHHKECKTEPVFTRNVQPSGVYERRTRQQVCVCIIDLCNSSPRPSTNSTLSYLWTSVLAVFIFQYLG